MEGQKHRELHSLDERAQLPHKEHNKLHGWDEPKNVIIIVIKITCFNYSNY